MSLWCDKYRPKKLDDVDFNKEQAQQLKLLVSSANFPHLAIFGCSGSGKKTRVNALLYELFGSSAQKLRMEMKVVEAPSGKKIEQHYITSNFHLEVNPSENGFYDRVVVQELIKSVANSGQALSTVKKVPFKLVVIHEADRLTREAQQALRRTLEKYAASCRVVLIGERASKLIPALKSRCLMIRNPAPTNEQITDILQNLAKVEDFVQSSNKDAQLPVDVVKRILEQSDRNLRRAILILQAYACSQAAIKSSSSSSGGNQKPILAFRWQEQIEELADKLVKFQTPQKIPEIRATLYELQIHLIPPELILRLLTLRLLKKGCLNNDRMRSNLLGMAAEIDHRISQGSKSIIHLEYFCCKFMALYKCSIQIGGFKLMDDYLNYADDDE